MNAFMLESLYHYLIFTIFLFSVVNMSVSMVDTLQHYLTFAIYLLLLSIVPQA